MTEPDDVRRAARWCAAVLEPLRGEPAATAAWCGASLALAVAALLLGDERIEADAAAAAAELRARLERGESGCDAEQAALVAALRFPLPDPRAATLDRGAEPLPCTAEVLRTVAFGSDDEAVALAVRIEAAGLASCDRAARRELALLVAARGFSALRARTKPATALQLLRAVAAERLDDDLVREALRAVRDVQRVDGAYGDLPMRTAFAGDIRYVVHLPRTVEALRLIHDALAPVPLLRSALQRVRSANDCVRSRRRATRPGETPSPPPT